jgi:cyclic-di-GMP-binding protein
MPSFDIVSELDQHELNNAVDQANREVGTRFDFKGSNAKFTQAENSITLRAEVDFQLQQMMDILHQKMTKRGVDVQHLKPEEPVIQHKSAVQTVMLQQGISQDVAKKIIKMIKNQKVKVQSQIQDEQVRVTGKKRDDLQEVMAMLREAELGAPLQFVNFRD